ncbi:arginyltransferase [Halomonas sabkhae]|uniref:arginyltransferase n=1 Tax=Halomonas sabkhae TaxID=626223 RepID=UPI0025B5E90C|nr:arginyltransferase [Halomonas sabkhae]MDN3526095.1 arginyltransferase [Halomonas sabkhae]
MSSNSPRQPVRDLRFYLTVPHACSYLEGREATTLFLDPQQSPGESVYDALTLLGFRRSGQHLYRPHCENCSACVSVRVPVEEFSPSRTQRKLRTRNADLSEHVRPATFDAEHYSLYAHYIRTRHRDGDMYPPSYDQYRTFLNLDQDYARLLELRLGDRLLAVSAFDQLQHGLSAIYTFFDPASQFDRRSLGTYAVLCLIERARRLGLPHVYLGYWIQESRKMAYKQNFRPLERLDGRHWRRLIVD